MQAIRLSILFVVRHPRFHPFERPAATSIRRELNAFCPRWQAVESDFPRGREDAEVTLRDARDAEFWTLELGVSERELRRAIDAVGPRVIALRRYLSAIAAATGELEQLSDHLARAKRDDEIIAKRHHAHFRTSAEMFDQLELDILQLCAQPIPLTLPATRVHVSRPIRVGRD